MTWTGTPEECKRKFGSIPVGAFLFILKFDGGEEKRGYHDGLGNASHIGIYTKQGKGALHSSQSKGQVCESAFAGKSINGGWNRIGLWDKLFYSDKINAILSGNTDDKEEEIPVVTATVYAEQGDTVNLRSRESTASGLVARVPIGSEVEALEKGDEWCKISANGHTGYMMSKFLKFGDEVEQITIEKPEAEKAYEILGGCLKQLIVNKGDVEAVYDIIGNWLGLRG